MSDFVKYVVKLLGKGCPLWASVGLGFASPFAIFTFTFPFVSYNTGLIFAEFFSKNS